MMEIISATSSHSRRLSGSIPTNSPEYLAVKRGIPLPYQPWLQLQVVRRSPGLVKMVSQGINGIIGGSLLFPYVAHDITDVIHAVAIQSLRGKNGNESASGMKNCMFSQIALSQNSGSKVTLQKAVEA